ncbi:right-handed parallel beta-helix repeat-containing protein [Paenibacillus sp. KQZ6P-2]|uniref:Right-handed parallel beta-helix repeat-containing protein n=1 Tax=Paenibacillus mangrovi TaxID=2931978 RepID=A0A9X1WVF5_9BACL|nr:right-handed parallel beta-helix repeat-containing protein [Paenibacillus mangrovi]MCJ8012634.1 right-handed parallel beta-helix repeat-containing protein [Paenibacillus mangrovi]
MQQPKEAKVIRVTDYGARPDSGEDAVSSIRLAIAAAAAVNEPVVIEFPHGRYDLYPDHADQALCCISNTTTEEENPDNTKTFGLLLQGLNHLTIEGNGSLLMFHGKMTLLAVISCSDIEIRNLNTDYAHPTMAEMTVEVVEERTMDVRVHPDSRYELEKDRLYWIGLGWRFTNGLAQLYDPANNSTWRVTNPVSIAVKVEELAPNRLRFHFDRRQGASVGQTFQMRDGIRDQVGAFIARSSNVIFKQVSMHYMHGLGIVGQFSENLVFDQMTLAPRPDSGRTAAAFADFLHLSGCRGRITIQDSLFEGAHDDPINVHGTHLRIVGKPAPAQLVVRFMHGQTFGFEAFFPGDEIEFVRESTLLAYDSNTVKEARLLNPREMLLTLERPAPEHIETNDVVENVTWTPEVEIRGNRFARIPTRGILVTTRRKVTIENNVFERMRMSGILIANDAGSWFESGRAQDVTIRGNTFLQCGSAADPVIWIHPENTDTSHETPVHEHIVIEDNTFETIGNRAMDAKSTRHVRFSRNRIVALEQDHTLSFVRLHACSNAEIGGNRFEGNDSMQCVELHGMPREEVSLIESPSVELLVV